MRKAAVYVITTMEVTCPYCYKIMDLADEDDFPELNNWDNGRSKTSDIMKSCMEKKKDLDETVKCPVCENKFELINIYSREEK